MKYSMTTDQNNGPRTANAADSRYIGGRLVVLGKKATPGVKKFGSTTVTAPRPLNTPSLRKENHGQDVRVNLVPSHRRNGWGMESSPSDANTTTRAPWGGGPSVAADEQNPDTSVADKPSGVLFSDYSSSGKWGDEAVEQDFMSFQRRGGDRAAESDPADHSNYPQYNDFESPWSHRDRLYAHHQDTSFDTGRTEQRNNFSCSSATKQLFDPKSGEMVDVEPSPSVHRTSRAAARTRNSDVHPTRRVVKKIQRNPKTEDTSQSDKAKIGTAETMKTTPRDKTTNTTTAKKARPKAPNQTKSTTVSAGSTTIAPASKKSKAKTKTQATKKTKHKADSGPPPPPPPPVLVVSPVVAKEQQQQHSKRNQTSKKVWKPKLKSKAQDDNENCADSVAPKNPRNKIEDSSTSSTTKERPQKSKPLQRRPSKKGKKKKQTYVPKQKNEATKGQP